MSTPPFCPYVGLTPYTEADARYFFGRDTETEIISANLTVSRLTLLYGPSGVGKSSVLRAGVMKQLQATAEEHFRYTDTPESIPVYFNQWQSKPLEGVQRAITDALAPYGTPIAAEGTFSEKLGAWYRHHQSQLLLILDQFEEYFLYYPDESGADSFFEQFIHAVNHRDLNVNFLLSLREDALAKLDRFKGQIPFLLQNRFDIQHLDRDQARLAITQPLEEYFKERGQRITAEPALVEEILTQVQEGKLALGSQGSGVTQNAEVQRIESPYLQLVLTRLWEEEVGAEATAPVTLRYTTLVDRLGGAYTIVRNYLNNTMATFDNAQRALAAAFFDRLVTPGGTKIALTADELTDFAAKALGKAESIVAPDVAALLMELTGKHRILRAVAAPEQPIRYEIFHDVLGSAIIEWTDRYEQGETQKQLEHQRAEAEARATQERNNSQRLRLLVAGLIVVLVAAIIATVFAFNQTARATAAEQDAQAQSRLTTSLRLAAESGNLLAKGEAPLALLTAIEAAQQPLGNGEPIPIEAIQQLHAVLGQTGGIPLLQDGDQIVALVVSPDGNWLAASGTDIVYVTNLRDLTQAPIPLKNETPVSSLAFSPDSRLLASGENVWNLKDPNQSRTPLSQTSTIVGDVRFSPEGKWLAASTYDRIYLWRVESLAQPAEVLEGSDEGISALAFSPDGVWLATGDNKGEAWLWNMARLSDSPVEFENNALDLDIDNEMDVDIYNGVSALTFSPDSRLLATGHVIGQVQVWNLQSPTNLPTLLEAHTDAVRALAFSPQGDWLATGSSDTTAQLWNLSDPSAEPIRLYGHTGAIYSLAFAPNGTQLATASADNKVNLWNVQEPTSNPIILRGHGDAVRLLAFAPDTGWLATGSDDGSVRLWNRPIREPYIFTGHTDRIEAVAISPDGNWLATASVDSTARLWNLETPTHEPILLGGHTGTIYRVAFSPDGNWLATGSEDQTVRLWNLQALSEPPVVLAGHANMIYSLAFSPDGTWLASGSEDQTVRLWNVEAPTTPPIVLEGHQGAIVALAFSPDSQRLATGSYDTTARLWNLQALDEPPTVLEGHTNVIYALAYSPDGNWIATGSEDATVRLWNTTIPTNPPIVLQGHNDEVYAVAFSPDSQWLATGANDSTARLWRVTAPDTLPVVLEDHHGTVYALAFTPDGRWLATSSTDGQVRLWDIQAPTREPINLGIAQSAVRTIAFSADGARLAAGSDDYTARVWTIPVESLIAAACDTVGRNMTPGEWQVYFGDAAYQESCP